MRAAEALVTLQASGFVIERHHNRLSVVPHDRITPGIEALIIANRDGLLELVRAKPDRATEQAMWWRSHIAALPVSTVPGHDRMIAALIVSAADAWLIEAARLDWNDVDVFGVHPVAPLGRVDCWGVAASLALSPHNRTGRDGRQHLTRLIEIGPDHATVETPTGTRFKHPREPRGSAIAVAVWDLPAFAPTLEFHR